MRMSRVKSGRIVGRPGLLIRRPGPGSVIAGMVAGIRRTIVRRGLASWRLVLSEIGLVRRMASPSFSSRVRAIASLSFPKLHFITSFALRPITVIVSKGFEPGPLWVVFHRAARHLFSPLISVFWARRSAQVSLSWRRTLIRLGRTIWSGRATRYATRLPVFLLRGRSLVVGLGRSVALHLGRC